MNLRPMLITNGLLVAAMTAVSVWAWQTIPAGAELPTQFDINGNPSRTTGKEMFLVLMPAVAIALSAMLWFLPRLDPRRTNMESNMKFWNVASISSVGILAYAHLLIVLNATGYKIDVLSALVPGLSLLFVALGNYLGKTRSNWFGGVRTPWSLSSDYSWEKTHHWAGRMMVASGLAGFAAWFLVDAKTALLVILGATIATSIAAVALSYVFWRADRDRAANGTH